MTKRSWLLPVLLLACDKPSAPAPAPAPVPSAAPIADAPEPPAVGSAAPPPTASSAPVVVASARAAPTAKPVAPAPSASAAAPAPKSATAHLAGNHFSLDVASVGCHAGSECAMTITLVPTGEFHVNKEYPYKFIANAAPNVAFVGNDWAAKGEKMGTMTVRFKPSAAGDTNVSGNYKFSVCSADQCQVEQQQVALVVPVM